MTSRIFVLVLLAHMVGDYLLQTRRLIDAKLRGQLSAHLLHALTFGVLAFILTIPWLSWSWGFALVLITLSHMLIDLTKAKLRHGHPHWAFQLEVGDLVSHIVVLLLVVVAWGPGLRQGPAFWTHFLCGILPYRLALYIAAVIFVTRGGTFLVRSLLEQLGRTPKERAGEPGASEYSLGRMIGNLERLLILAFVVIGNYGAIGFVLAAKSIARFKELENRQFAEYYLIGTLTSTLVGLVAGWALILLKQNF